MENKCKIFAWILVQDKTLTAHNLQKRGWPRHEHCMLCNGPLETGLHLCLCCPFAKAVWNQVISWENFPELQSQPQADPVHIKAWWEETARKVPTSERRRLNGMVIYYVVIRNYPSKPSRMWLRCVTTDKFVTLACSCNG